MQPLHLLHLILGTATWKNFLFLWMVVIVSLILIIYGVMDLTYYSWNIILLSVSSSLVMMALSCLPRLLNSACVQYVVCISHIMVWISYIFVSYWSCTFSLCLIIVSYIFLLLIFTPFDIVTVFSYSDSAACATYIPFL